MQDATPPPVGAAGPDNPTLALAFEQLGDCKHLTREKGLRMLTSVMQKGAAEAACVLLGVSELLAGASWEKRLGGLMAAKAYVEPGQAGEQHPRQEALQQLQDCALGLLEDGEVRVRLGVGELLQSLARQGGLPVYEACSERVLHSIESNFDRVDAADDTSANSAAADKAMEAGIISGRGPAAAPASSLVSQLLQSTYKRVVPGQGELRHGTEGWKCLETSMKALQALVEGCGPAIKPHLDARLRNLLYSALLHPNRFVRETGHFTLCTVCEALKGPELVALAPEIAPAIANGMSDNWSQVRYASCVSARSFMKWLGPDRDVVLPILLPPMCLNRYYVAEGVRLYAQQTWQLVMGTNGREAVAAHIKSVVEFYVAQSKANNHAVREAGCACIAELMEKVDKEAVGPYVPVLFKALVTCFKDMSWPVRDAACTAAGRCVLAYPEEMRPWAGEMLALWLAHLADNIPTVRENSAVALGKALRVYGDEVLPQLLAALEALLPAAVQQHPESTKYSQLESVTRFGVAARKARDNDPQVHSGQEMFSCGSLMARFSTSYLIRSDGCMDHGFNRDKEPWELSDGGVYLLREVALVRPEAVTAEHMEALRVLGNLSAFQHAFNLHETLWRNLPKIATAIGKPRFKPHLRDLLEPLVLDTTCGHQLAEAAAGQCLAALRTWLGPTIIEGYMPSAPSRAAA